MSKEYSNPVTLRRLYWSDGLSLPQIGAMYSVTAETIWYWMNVHGVSRRPPPTTPRRTDGNKQCSRCGEVKPLAGFYKNARRPDGVGVYCKPCEIAVSTPHRRSEAGRDGARKRAIRRRERLIADLGGCCVCCRETQYEFLQFDHINSNGAEHRRELGRTSLSTSDIRKRISEFQILCASCNFAKGFYGECPHRRMLRTLKLVA